VLFSTQRPDRRRSAICGTLRPSSPRGNIQARWRGHRPPTALPSLTRKSRHGPQRRPFPINEPHTRDSESTHPTQDTDAGSDSQFTIQRNPKVYGGSCKQRPAQVVGCKQTGRVFRVDPRQVYTHTLQDDESANRIDRDAEQTDDPVNVAVRGPAEEEEADWW
jgi:hypothetical protein